MRFTCSLLCLALVAVLGVPIQAVESVGDIQFSLFGGDAFLSPGFTFASGEFGLFEDAGGDMGTVSGQIRKSTTFGYYDYQIRGGSISLTPCELLADQSYSAGGLNPDIAKGIFSGGAVVLTITGAVTTPGAASVIIPDTTLLVAEVTADFVAHEEEGFPPNVIDAQLTLNVIGGTLWDGDILNIYPQIVADITLLNCSQPSGQGSNVANFQDDISYNLSSVQIYPVPEPLTAMLLVCGLLAVKRRR